MTIGSSGAGGAMLVESVIGAGLETVVAGCENTGVPVVDRRALAFPRSRSKSSSIGDLDRFLRC